MTHAFKTISAKPTFGSLRENIYQSDYINRKKGLLMYCNSQSTCNKSKVSSSYNNINSFNLGRSLVKCNILPVNKSNLIIGQYSKTNLTDVCSISKGPPPNTQCSSEIPCNPCQNNLPVTINETSTVPLYFDYTIDPLGELFGKSQCGELNYINYIVFYPPTK
jgi:hypothetical protein